MTQPPRQLDDYELLHTLGRGNTSQVRLAVDPQGQQVALKIPHPETLGAHEAATRFGNEVRLTLQFRHPHIVRGYAGTAFGQRAFLATEYFPLGALSDQIEQAPGGQLPLPAALRVLADVASALAYLHQHGAVHQDVKTQNVYVNAEGRASLGDLGSAYFISQGGKVSGSPFYMAPEVYHGEGSSSASDVYSLGIMMYEVLTGKRPYLGNTYEELMVAHMTRFPTPLSHLNPEVPRPVAKLVELALAKRPQDRPTAEAMQQALCAALGENETEEEKPAPPPPVMGRHMARPQAEPAPAPPAKEEKKSSWNPFKRR